MVADEETWYALRRIESESKIDYRVCSTTLLWDHLDLITWTTVNLFDSAASYIALITPVVKIDSTLIAASPTIDLPTFIASVHKCCIIRIRG